MPQLSLFLYILILKNDFKEIHNLVKVLMRQSLAPTCQLALELQNTPLRVSKVQSLPPSYLWTVCSLS